MFSWKNKENYFKIISVTHSYLEHSAFGIEKIMILHGSLILCGTGKLLMKLHEVHASESLLFSNARRCIFI